MTQIKSQLRPTSLNVNILKRRPHDSCVNGKNMLIAENRPELQTIFLTGLNRSKLGQPAKKKLRFQCERDIMGKINTFVRLYNVNA